MHALSVYTVPPQAMQAHLAERHSLWSNFNSEMESSRNVVSLQQQSVTSGDDVAGGRESMMGRMSAANAAEAFDDPDPDPVRIPPLAPVIGRRHVRRGDAWRGL